MMGPITLGPYSHAPWRRKSPVMPGEPPLLHLYYSGGFPQRYRPQVRVSEARHRRWLERGARDLRRRVEQQLRKTEEFRVAAI